MDIETAAKSKTMKVGRLDDPRLELFKGKDTTFFQSPNPQHSRCIITFWRVDDETVVRTLSIEFRRAALIEDKNLMPRFKGLLLPEYQYMFLPNELGKTLSWKKAEPVLLRALTRWHLSQHHQDAVAEEMNQRGAD